MTRRLLLSLLAVPFAWASGTLRGKLLAGAKMLASEGREVALTGDASTVSVINDSRLKDCDLEAAGEFLSPAEFKIGPIHQRNLFVHKDGQRFTISYWCPVCSIRTYTPGPCMCCQEETALDLRAATI